MNLTGGGFKPDLCAAVTSCVRIAGIELLRHRDGQCYVRARSADGAAGIAPVGEHPEHLASLLKHRVAPCFIGQDARELPELVDRVYLANANYKLAGLPFWSCVAWCECALLDLLGRVANRSVGQLLGGVLRREVKIYLSSMRRDTSPQEEVDWLAQRLAETGAKAVKLKIGGRMSRNRDATPGRSESLVRLARKTFGDGVALYVDANGSYDAPHAIEVGRMLQDSGVSLFEEPCEWEDYQATRAVAEALEMPVAGGEQDSSLYRWRDMIREGTVDVVQPDIIYNGGFLRTIRVAEMAAERNLSVVPHSPKADAAEVYMLHFVSRTSNAGPYHEYDAGATEPLFKVRDGALAVPAGPGLGLGVEPEAMAGGQLM